MSKIVGHLSEAYSGGQLTGRRIIFVLYSLHLGGAERQALLLGRYLRDVQKADVEIWAFYGPGRASELCDEFGLRWRVIPHIEFATRAFRYQSLLRLLWQILKARPDVLLPYTAVPNIVCGLIWRLTGAKVCVWNQRDEGQGCYGKWQRAAVRLTQHFVANSRQGADFLVQELGVERRLVRVVHNGVELAVPVNDRVTWRHRLRLSEDAFVATMVANLHGFKDHVTLIKAWKVFLDRLGNEPREAVLMLAGRPDGTQEMLQSLTHDLGLEQFVRFLGRVDDVAGLLSATDLGVFSSRLEGMPNGVLECMAAGLAVAGTDIPGIREAVGPENYPLLAPVGDTNSR